MVKPKPEKKPEWISFTISPDDKKKWEQYATSLGFPLARVIKEIVNQKIDLVENNPTKDMNNKLVNEINEMKEQLKTISSQYFDLLKNITPKSNLSLEEITQRVMFFLSDLGELTRERITEYILSEKDLANTDNRNLVRKALSILKDDGKIDYILENQTWKVI